jgi:hypothetical protein
VSAPGRAHEAFDIHPVTGASIEVFFADRSLETFGRGRGRASAGLRRPVRRSARFLQYAAFRNALLALLGRAAAWLDDVTLRVDALIWRDTRPIAGCSFMRGGHARSSPAYADVYLTDI